MKKLLSVSLLLIGSALSGVYARAQVIVIANQSVAASAVSKDDLRKVFSAGESNLKDGSHVVPVLLRQGPTHTEFLTAYVGKSDAGLQICWRGLVMTGQATMPKAFESEEEVVQYVGHKAGAIGYISEKTPHEGVKVLAVH
jgi:ABC-type phosphate transport system substrate-binding protein